MSPRVLFCPWSAGGGAGYTGRALAAAARLDGRFECAFGPSGVARMVAEGGHRMIGEPAGDTAPEVVPAFLPFANVERVFAVTARYYRPRVLSEHLRRDLAAIDEYRPDIVVTDMQPTAVLAARLRGLPLVSIADTDFLDPSPNSWMPWSCAPPTALLPHPSALDAINSVATGLGLDPIGSVPELLWGDLTVVPSSPLVEAPPPAPPGRAGPVYVGPLYWDPPGAPYLPRAAAGTRRVYVSIGSGGMVTDTALREVLAACDRPDLSVFLSAGFQRRDWLARHSNVELGGFTGITGPITWADLMVNHGGYSTVIAGLLHGTPQVVLPFMSEQEANGRLFLADHGAGLVARTTRVEQDGRIRYVNRHSGDTDDPVVPAADLRLTIQEALDDPTLAQRADYARDSLTRLRADADLAELFATLLR
ncbi:glycosyltransferase [Micromonospora halophytica]|uniref:UDP:flavonoid glycosyltransferase YjiC, YdhE family n=1 Tax=Micromonospora halophytica TaxID=47864 RepID=A0A1C5ILR2_9ACTN|nr:nucleotide disphospho-sugar-binding domain-containing protein [Micromonospora halophytica]SCG59244.1 UDP:flavonoid glycosyltransferase YjiC, YdhE family [Micromonospora halophytica]